MDNLKSEDNVLAEQLPEGPLPRKGDAEQIRNKRDFVSRREFLALLGVAGAGAFVVPRIPSSATWAAEAENQGSSATGRLRRWCMVVDLRRCDGCVGLDKPPQCTQACILTHHVPDGMEWVQVYHTEINKHSGGTYFFPLHCQQCENPPCTNVCPVGATFTTPEGPVLIDQKRCIGCRMCMAACPYDRRFFNWGHPNLPAEAKARLAQYDPEKQAAYIGTVMKCDMCPDHAREGKVAPCVDGCPRGAIYYGDLEEDMASNGREIVKVSSYLARNQAYRYKEHLGTQPRVYFIPGHGQDAGRSPYDRRKSRRKELQWPKGT